MDNLTLYVGLGVSVFALFTYIYKISKQLTKLDKIDGLEESIKTMNKNLVNDLVSIKLLNQRVDHLEEEIKEIKALIKAKG